MARRIGEQGLFAALAEPTLVGTTAERLSQLLRWDLGFRGQNSGYGSHNLHAFAAKFPPQIPRLFIRHLTERGELVLDPMVGSGTTLVEAGLLGRQGVGFDLDPLAARISRGKTTALSSVAVEQAGRSCLEHAARLGTEAAWVATELDRRFGDEARRFLDYWFAPQAQRQLLALIASIEQIEDEEVRNFLRLVFSSVIITKSGGVSLARDLAHSRPHREANKKPRDAFAEFAKRLSAVVGSSGHLPAPAGVSLVGRGDARRLPLADETVDLVVTSPPYANAIDYVRAHKFSLVWLGTDLSDLRVLRARYVGSERCDGTDAGKVPASVRRVVSRLRRLDARKAALLLKYFADMRLVLSEISRVLRHGRAAVVVVGNSTLRGMPVPTHRCLAALGEDVGLRLVGIGERQLDRDRRMMPASFQRSNAGIELRMHKEYVLGLIRP